LAALSVIHQWMSVNAQGESRIGMAELRHDPGRLKQFEPLGEHVEDRLGVGLETKINPLHVAVLVRRLQEDRRIDGHRVRHALQGRPALQGCIHGGCHRLSSGLTDQSTDPLPPAEEMLDSTKLPL
jgi:hypothetical protein